MLEREREVRRLADEFFLTAAAQRNRAHAEASGVRFIDVPFGVQEVLFDAQTSGGLLVALPRPDAEAYVEALSAARSSDGTRLGVAIIGTVTDRAADTVCIR